MKILHLAALLASPLAVLAAINIMVETDDNNQLVVRHSGSQRGLINQAEINMFHLNHDLLLEAARRFFGGRPINVFLRDPVFTRPRYAWWGYPEVTCTSSVHNARIRTDNQAVMNLFRHQLINDHPTREVTFLVSEFTEVEATVTSVWSQTREVNVEKSINYGLRVAGGSLDMSWSRSMGNSTSQSVTQVIGQTLESTVVVPPNSTITVEILATRSVVDVLIDYMLELSGVSITWYRLIRHGRNYWGHPIREMLAAAHVPFRRFISESMQIGFFFGGAINTYNAAGELIESKKLNITTKPISAEEPKPQSNVMCLPLDKH